MEIEIAASKGAAVMGVAPGLAIEAPLFVTARDINGYDAHVEVVPENGRLVARQVTVARRPGGPPVTGEALRGIPVAQLTRRAGANVIMSAEELPDGTLLATTRIMSEPLVKQLREEGPTDRTLEWIAFVYRRAMVLGDPPTKAVEETLEVSRATAGRWISHARDRGLLGPTEGQGRAAG